MYLTMKNDRTIKTYSTSVIAKIIGLHPNTVRLYEEWGLIHKPERRPNGYRVYDSCDISRLKIIRSLRCANYSLSAILRMLKKLDSGMCDENILDILNTPDKDEDINSACDKLIVSLENAIANAYEAIEIIKEIKQMLLVEFSIYVVY